MPGSLFTIALFFAYTWGLGFSLTRLVRESEGFLERNLMRLGLGLSAFVVLGTVLNALRIPLDYRIFLLVSAAVPVYWLVFKKGYSRFPGFSMKLTLSNINVVIVLAIFAVSLFMYSSGAFRYPYLEDDDPWGHASSAKYVAVEKTAFAPPNYNFHYLDPYPPAYDMLFGVLHQASPSLSWAIKFFNALIISLGLVFFYFFAKEFAGNRNKALFATFVLASVPAYLSHFIWSPALAIALFPQAMYALEMIKNDRKWWAVAGVCFAAILLTHPTHAVKLTGLVLIYIGVKAAASFALDRKQLPKWLRQNLSYFWAVIFGIFLSLFWWGLKWKGFLGTAKVSFKGGADAATEAIKSSGGIIAKLLALPTRVFNTESGTATRIYTLRDFVVVHSTNMINNPIGLGVFVSALLLIGIISALVTAARLLPRPRVVLAAAAAFVVLASIIVTSNIFEYQQNLYEFRKATQPDWWFPQFWPLPPSSSSVFAMSLPLVLIVAAFLLSLASIIAAKDETRQARPVFFAIALGWLLFTFLGINSLTFNLPVGLFAFRFWMIFAIPAALLAAEGLFALLSSVNLFKLDAATAKAAKIILVAVVVAGILFTSAKQKYDVNTACWPAGAFWSGELVLDQASGCVTQSEVMTFSWLTTLPPNTKVFTFSNPDQVLGFDKLTCAWCKPEYDMKKRFYNVTPVELHSFMRDNGYDYFIIGGIDMKTYSFNSTLAMIDAVASSGLFTVANQGQAAIIFRAV